MAILQLYNSDKQCGIVCIVEAGAAVLVLCVHIEAACAHAAQTTFSHAGSLRSQRSLRSQFN
jgi:hypothetical protein